MVYLRYSVAQLEKIRESPLVRKPDGLPSIEQWMETPDAARGKLRSQSSRNDDLTTSETGQRPSLLQTRHLSRTSTTGADDIVLGPPKMAFASATSTRTLSKPSQMERANTFTSSEEHSGHSRTGTRSGISRDREVEGAGDRAGTTNGRWGGVRDGAESWTTVRTRRGVSHDEGDRSQKNNDRTKGPKEGDFESTHETAGRRNGHGRNRFESPWHRDDGEGVRLNTRSSSGWRDKDQRDDRDWSRSAKIEEEPEWMETCKKVEKKQTHTQEDFQRWKERMKAGVSHSAEEKEEDVKEPVPVPKATASTNKPAAAPLTLEGGLENSFGLWGEKKRSEDLSAGAKALAVKPKPSRFAGFFAPQEEPANLPQKTINTTMEAAMASTGNLDASDDKAGFQRILAMLGNANLNQPQSQPPTAAPQPAPRKNSSLEITGFDSHGSPPPLALPDMHQSRPREQSLPTQEDWRGVGEVPRLSHDNYASSRPSMDQLMQAAPATSIDAGGPRSYIHRDEVPNISHEGPKMASRHNDMYDSFSPPQESGPGQSNGVPLSRDREFLLNLMQQSNHGLSQGTAMQNPTQNQPDQPNFLLFAEGKRPKIQAPKPKPPVAGFVEEGNFMDADMHNHQMLEPDMPQDFMGQAGGPRPPPGFYDEMMMANMQRRSGGESARQQASNMGIPQQSPDQAWMKSNFMPPQDRIAPPPGFPNAVHQPPGFGGPSPSSFAAMNNPYFPAGMGRGMGGGPSPGFPNQMPPPGFFPGPAPPPGFTPGHMMQEGVMGGPMPPPRRGQFDMYADMNQGRPMGRGGPGGGGPFGI